MVEMCLVLHVILSVSNLHWFTVLVLIFCTFVRLASQTEVLVCVDRRLKATWQRSPSTAPSSSSTLALGSCSSRSFTRLSGPDRNVLDRWELPALHYCRCFTLKMKVCLCTGNRVNNNSVTVSYWTAHQLLRVRMWFSILLQNFWSVIFTVSMHWVSFSLQHQSNGRQTSR